MNPQIIIYDTPCGTKPYRVGRYGEFVMYFKKNKWCMKLYKRCTKKQREDMCNE